MSSYTSKYSAAKKRTHYSPAAANNSPVVTSPSSHSSHHGAAASTLSTRSRRTHDTTSTVAPTESPTMQQIRRQTLRRRRRFKKMQEREKQREMKRRERALQERKKRLKELDPRGNASETSSQYSRVGATPPRRRRPQKQQQKHSRLVESLDLQSSVHDSTQMFKLAEKLAKERDVTASKAVNILNKKMTSPPHGKLKNGSAGTPTSSSQKPPTGVQSRIQQQERINARQRFIGQKFKLQPVEIPSRKQGSTSRRTPKARNGGTPSSLATPTTPSTVVTTFTAITEPLPKYQNGDTVSMLSSNYDYDDQSILSAPSRMNIDKKRKKKRRSRPWREKPVIPQKKKFETGYSIEISNVENSIANLDKILNSKKKKIEKAARERVLWLKTQEDMKKKKQKEKVEEVKTIHQRIPHEDYGKYIEGEEEEDASQDDFSDEDNFENDLEEDDFDDILEESFEKQHTLKEDDEKSSSRPAQTTQHHEQEPPTQTPSSDSKPRRVSFSRGNNQLAGAVPTSSTRAAPQSSRSNLIRRVPSQKTIPNAGMGARTHSMGQLSQQHQHNQPVNTLQQLGSGESAPIRREDSSTISSSNNVRNEPGPSQKQRIQEDVAPLAAATIRNTHRPIASTIRRSPKNAPSTGGLTLRNRRFMSNRNRSHLPAPSKVANYRVIGENDSNSRKPTFGNSDTKSQHSFLENSVQVSDDDIPDMPLLKRHSFGRQVDTKISAKKHNSVGGNGHHDEAIADQNDTEEGGQINVADSKALEMLGLK